MKNTLIRSTLASLAVVAIAFGATLQPAKADTAATTRILVGAAALAAIATEINVQHKHQVANTVVGYLPDGSPVYQDGHVVAASNGQSWYPGNYGQSIACSNNQCYVSGSANAYNPNYGYAYSGNGNFYGQAGHRRRGH